MRSWPGSPKNANLPLGQEQAISQQLVDESVQAHQAARGRRVRFGREHRRRRGKRGTANRANVTRGLQQMQSFGTPFSPHLDGVVTERNIERGDLVGAGGGASGRAALQHRAERRPTEFRWTCRQSEAVNIRDGQKASVEGQERTGRGIHRQGRPERQCPEQRRPRTMLTEVQVDNRDGSLLPGMYAQVKFTLAQPHASLIIPTSSLVIDRNGMHVVTVDQDHKLHFVPVTVGRDMGTQVEVVNGLQGSESLVASPSDPLNDGQIVEVR